MSCTTCAYFGSLRALVSRCKTKWVQIHTVEVTGSNPVAPTILPSAAFRSLFPSAPNLDMLYLQAGEAKSALRGILLAIRENALLSAGPGPAQQVASRPNAGPSALSEKWGFALALLLIVATVALYQPVKHYPFITYDDRDYVTRNIQVQAGLDWDTVQWAFTSFYCSNWHPLTWLSHALDCQLFGLNSGGHHDTNVLLHALNAALLFWVLWRATGYAGRSFVVAALFALHP